MVNVAHEFNQIVSSVVENVDMIAESKAIVHVRGLTIHNKQGVYYISDPQESRILFSELNMIDSACAICRFYQMGNLNRVREVLAIDAEYQKYKHDMMHYAYTYEHVSDQCRRDILNVKYDVAYQKTRSIRRSMKRMNKLSENR